MGGRKKRKKIKSLGISKLSQFRLDANMTHDSEK